MNPFIQQPLPLNTQVIPRINNPLQCIKSIQQSMQALKSKITQMQRKQSQNHKQIQKVFYSSIPVIQSKLSQSDEYEKFLQKKQSSHSQTLTRQLHEINRERKMINQKEIQRNRELMNIMKINQHNSIKELSKKNQIFIQKMKNIRIEENKKKRELVRSGIEKSREKVVVFHVVKQEELKKLKEQEKSVLERKVYKMLTQLQKLNNKENQTISRVEKSSQALRHLRFAVNKLEKMHDNDFIKIKKKVIVGENDIEKQSQREKEKEKEKERENQLRKLEKQRKLTQMVANDEQVMSKILTEVITKNSSVMVQKEKSQVKTSYGKRFYSNHVSKD